MKCPVCETQLEHVRYEGIRVHQCPSCVGLAIPGQRKDAVLTRDQKSKVELWQEIREAGADSKQPLRCCRCFRTMEKRQKKAGPLSFLIDRCLQCDLLWLDRGEIARLQVIYELSDQGQEANRFRDRLANMTPAERQAFESRIANLPVENIALEIAGIMACRLGLYQYWN